MVGAGIPQKARRRKVTLLAKNLDYTQNPLDERLRQLSTILIQKIAFGALRGEITSPSEDHKP